MPAVEEHLVFGKREDMSRFIILDKIFLYVEKVTSFCHVSERYGDSCSAPCGSKIQPTYIFNWLLTKLQKKSCPSIVQEDRQSLHIYHLAPCFCLHPSHQDTIESHFNYISLWHAQGRSQDLSSGELNIIFTWN